VTRERIEPRGLGAPAPKESLDADTTGLSEDRCLMDLIAAWSKADGDLDMESKWNEIDVDGNGLLEGEEIEELAEWVWCSFRPGKTIDPDTRKREAIKLMKICDEDGDGAVDKSEFKKYFMRTTMEIIKHKSSMNAGEIWEELDPDGIGSIDEHGLTGLVDWIWTSFRPGTSITDISPEEREKELLNVMQECDKDGSGTVDREAFQAFYLDYAKMPHDQR